MPISSPAFLCPTPLQRIRSLAAKHKGHVAVPFLGKNASKLLPLKKGSVLITRVTLADVKQGLVSPAEVLNFLAAGVEVHSCTNLHAKVYVFGSRAVVGSANVSSTSESLLEAALETTEPKAVEQARTFVENLMIEPVTKAFAESLVPYYREDRVGGWSEARNLNAGPKSKNTKGENSPMCIFPLVMDELSDEEEAAEAKGMGPAKLAVQDKRKNKVESICWASPDWSKFEVGDRVIQRFPNGRGYSYCPVARIVRIEQVKSKRSAVLFLEVPRRDRTVSSTVVRKALGDLAKPFVRDTSEKIVVRAAEAAAKFEALW